MKLIWYTFLTGIHITLTTSLLAVNSTPVTPEIDWNGSPQIDLNGSPLPRITATNDLTSLVEDPEITDNSNQNITVHTIIQKFNEMTVNP
jgi:hypothetical protein